MSISEVQKRGSIISRLALLFILSYFFLFSYDSLRTYFTFDDAMAMVPFHHQFEKPIWANFVEVLKVFTTADRPLGAFFYRPIYWLFGFNPLPFRIAVEILLVINIGLAFLWVRALGATREAAALATLIFCYNASMVDLYYNTATIYDILCFSLYIGAMLVYMRGRSNGQPLKMGRIGLVALLYLLALDAKEMAVTLPATLLIYELLFRFRDYKSRPLIIRTIFLLGPMFVASGSFSRIKVLHLAQGSAYHTHLSLQAVLLGLSHYLEQLFYRAEGSISGWMACAIVVGLIGMGALLRSRAAIFGMLFFFVVLLPVAIIPARSGYAAYIAYPGLCLALGAILASARFHLVRLTKMDRAQLPTAILLFVCIAVVHVKLQASNRLHAMGNMTWDQPKRAALMRGFRQTIPEFPPNARVLITKDSWGGGEWGPMFLTRLLYNNATVWVDRAANMDRPPDLATYDILVAYKEPFVDMIPATLFGHPLPWEIRALDAGGAQFVVSSPNPNRNIPTVEFLPAAVRSGHAVKFTAPGLANSKIDVLYRILSGNQSTAQFVQGWCTLDNNGSGTIVAPPLHGMGMLVVDWIRPAGEHWIFTSGVLTIAE